MSYDYRVAEPYPARPYVTPHDVPDMPRALCKEADPEDHYRGHRLEIAAAKEMCAACPERLVCLDWAIATREPFGIWVGLTPEERDRVRRAS